MTERVGGLGEWLTDVRGLRSQQAFADLFGITRAQLANYETGRTKPRKALIRRIAKEECVPMPDQHRDTAETAWLVESGPTRAPMYLRVWEARWVWTLDPFKAFRCAREHDAIALAKCHAGTDHMPPALRAVEHSFVLDDGAV